MTEDKEWAKKYEAPAGQVWVCMACGKRSTNRANCTIDYGWDASCFMNAELVPCAGS